MKPTNNNVDIFTPPTGEPVSVDDLKLHAKLNYDGPAADPVLSRSISAARRIFEAETDGRICLPTVFKQTLTSWPCDGIIWLQKAKVLTVGSVKYWDETDAQQTLDPADYHLDLAGVPGLVHVPSPPGLSPTRLRPIVIQFTAGWPDAGSVPDDVKTAILNLATLMVQYPESHGENELKEIPGGFVRICDTYRTGLKGY